MTKLNESKPDKFLKLVKDQENKLPPPPPLGEPAGSTDWIKHVTAGHGIKTFSKIVDDGQGNKKIHVNSPNKGMIFVPAIEEVNNTVIYERTDFIRWIWIYCIEEKSGRIIFKENSGHVDFVDWDIPVKAE